MDFASAAAAQAFLENVPDNVFFARLEDGQPHDGWQICEGEEPKQTETTSIPKEIGTTQSKGAANAASAKVRDTTGAKDGGKMPSLAGDDEDKELGPPAKKQKRAPKKQKQAPSKPQGSPQETFRKV